MRKPSELSWLLYGGGVLTAVGVACVEPAYGLITMGVWFGMLGVLYVLRGEQSRAK